MARARSLDTAELGDDSQEEKCDSPGSRLSGRGAAGQ